MKRNCKHCSKSFIPKKYNLARGGGFFCSKKCYHKAPKDVYKKGSESPFWKGGDASYGAIHDWIKSMFGSATKCENPDCKYPRKTKNGTLEKPKTFDWALKKGRTYGDRKKDSFIQLCRSCHKKYDFIEKKHKRGNGGNFVKK